MEVINILKDRNFRTLFTGGYVIDERSFGCMGSLHAIGDTEFVDSSLTRIVLEHRWSFQILERIQGTLDWAPIVDFEQGIKGLVQERLSPN